MWLPRYTSSVKLPKKFAFEKFGAREFKLIKQLFRFPDYAKINHIDKLDVRLAMLLCEYLELLGSRYVQYYTPQDWGGMLELYLQEIQLIAVQLNMADIIERICRCAGIGNRYYYFQN